MPQASNDIRQIADAELLARLQRLAHADHALTARLLVHMSEVDIRGLYRERAYSSMFDYCVEELRMSESAAYLRIHAARLGRRFPLVVELLAQGALNLTTIKLIGPQLTADNHVQVLERARGKRKRDIERLVAELAPQPDVPSHMRKLPDPVSGITIRRFERSEDATARFFCSPNAAASSVHPTAQPRPL